MHLAIATWDDFISVSSLVSQFHLESPYAHIPVKHAKVNETILSFFQGNTDRICILLMDDKEAVGIIAGHLTEPTFCDIKIAHELVWFVMPEYRKGTWPIRLRTAFEYWAENVVKADITQMSSLNNEYAERLNKHYEKKGYKLFEMAYLKENNNGRS